MVSENQPISSRLHNIYSKELFVSGDDADFEKAVPFFENSLLDEYRADDEKLEAVCVLAKAYRILKNGAKFAKYALLSNYGLCSELCCEIAGYFYDNGEYEEAMKWYDAAQNQTLPVLNIEYGKKVPSEGIEKCKEKISENK